MAGDELADSFDELLSAVSDAARELRGHEFYAEEENRAGAHMFLLGMLVARIEEHVLFDPDFPYFRVIDTRIREGGDNSDQRYLVSRLTPGESYRIWGTLGDARRLELQVYAGDPYRSDGRMASYLGFEDLHVEDDGTFEVIASPTRQPGNWLENPADSTRILVRQIYSDWERSTVPGDVHIDRMGHEGDLRPRLEPADLVGRLRAATVDLGAQTSTWPANTLRAFHSVAPNRLAEPFDPGSVGGVPGRWMVRGHFDLARDEALVITAWPGAGGYQGIQLTDPWFSSLEYANRQTSLTADQAHLDPDGAYRFVVCDGDPGVPNWLDTTGRRTGVILMRFDGSPTPDFPPAEHPQAVTVRLGRLDRHLPEGTPRVDPAERARQIAARRRHVQHRFGN